FAFTALHHNGETDYLDDKMTLKSTEHDISSTIEAMTVKIEGQFLDELEKGMRQTFYSLLLVPSTVQMTQFDNLRQAKALGVIEVERRSGPP
ncbi:MAG TPA: hypothetical protein VME45_02505, partial [Stellaceae bacterium]|nr:hypothetical protein [Stellaceae bacterium]